MNTIKIVGTTYRIVDAIEYITLADSFVKNKIGTGHGEAKLYVGNESERLQKFFDDYSKQAGIYLKTDFIRYLNDAKQEFQAPQQEYVNKSQMGMRYSELLRKVSEVQGEILDFTAERVGVEPPRVYIKSTSKVYELMREVALPNLSYLSILKLQKNDGGILYYYRIFVDFHPDVITYKMPSEIIAENEIASSDISETQKKRLTSARVGQGEYRKKLLEECSICPFTLVNDERMLVASHIKPWVNSENDEKIDPKNGFIFTPTYDKLFDLGFITFDDNKVLQVSNWISPMNQKRLNIYSGKTMDKLPLDEEREKYLHYHRENVFKS